MQPARIKPHAKEHTNNPETPPKLVVEAPHSVPECLCGSQVLARDFDSFSTDFVRSVFVVYAHNVI